MQEEGPEPTSVVDDVTKVRLSLEANRRTTLDRNDPLYVRLQGSIGKLAKNLGKPEARTISNQPVKDGVQELPESLTLYLNLVGATKCAVIPMDDYVALYNAVSGVEFENKSLKRTLQNTLIRRIFVLQAATSTDSDSYLKNCPGDCAACAYGYADGRMVGVCGGSNECDELEEIFLWWEFFQEGLDIYCP